MAIYKEKIAVAYDALIANDIDLWIIAGQESATNAEPMLACLGEFEFIGLTALLFSRDQSSAVICTPIDADGYKRLNAFNEIIPFPMSFVKTLSDFLKAKNPKKIALDYSVNNPASDGLTVGIYNLLKEALLNSHCQGEFVSAEPLVNLVRGIKTDDELARIKKA